MGQVLHGSARTTEAVRRAIQLRQESVRASAKRYGVSPTTIQKWRARRTTGDSRMGPKEPHSSVLSMEEEAIIVAFRRHTLLPLDDCLYGLQPTIPHLTRSSLHRCLERYGISRLPEIDGDKPIRKRFASYPIGYVHIDIAQVSTGEGKLALFVAINRTSKFAFAQLVPSAGKIEAAQFLRELIAVLPYRIHTVLTDNGFQFTPRRQHIFDRVCGEHYIEHRLCQGEPSVGQRSGRTDEPDDQGRDRQALPLRQPPSPAGALGPVRGRIQSCAAAEDPAWPDTLRVHPPGLDEGARPLQARSVTPHPGIIHPIRFTIRTYK